MITLVATCTHAAHVVLDNKVCPKCTRCINVCLCSIYSVYLDSLARDLRCLNGLERLTTINLDSNQLDSHAQFPNLPNLKVLWVNRNKISNLSVFIENLSLSSPHLLHLSMMNNVAAPSFFNGGSRQDYDDYRCVGGGGAV